MGQTNAIRVQFDPRQLITSSANNTRQLMAFTNFNDIGDIVDIEARDARGNRISTLVNNIAIVAIEDGVAMTFASAVDTSVTLPVGAIGYYLVTQPIDDAQAAIERLYRRANKLSQLNQPIVAFAANTPAGKTTLYVNDVDMFQAGDAIQVLADSGLFTTSTIFSVDINADETNNKSAIVINSNVDLTAAVNPKLVSTALTSKDYLRRLRTAIDAIDLPVENEFVGSGNGSQTAWPIVNLFLVGKTKLMMDGRRLRLGSSGTRASLVSGTTNSQVTFTSMIMGLAGNAVKVAIVNAAGTTVAVTGNFEDNNYVVSVNNNSGAATAAQIASAINSDVNASKVVQAIFGGTGAGVAAAAAATSLTGGLDDGTGDYAEIPQVFNNALSQTGYKYISLHIRPDDSNRLAVPPRDTEELVVDYRRALSNA